MILDNLFFTLPSSQIFPVDFLKFEYEQNNTIIEKLVTARKLVLNNEYDKALTYYSELIETNPSQPFFYACRSIVNTKLNDFEGAFYDYQVAKRLDLNYHNFLEWIENSGEMEVSDDLLELINYPKSDVQYFLNRATLYVQHFDYEKAIEDFNMALQIGATPVIFVTRGAVYMRLLRYDLALADFNQALQKDTKLVQGLLYRAKLYVAIREYNLANVDFNTALELDNTNEYIYEERAQFYELIGKWDLAIMDYSQVILKKPTDFYFYVLRAELYEKNNKLEEALKDYNKAISLNPYYSDLYQYRGEVFLSLGDQKSAEKDFSTFESLENEED